MQEFMQIDFLTTQQWCALSPVLVLSVFSIFSLVLAPAKEIFARGSFLVLIMGAFLTMALLCAQGSSAHVEISQGLLVFDAMSRFFGLLIILSLVVGAFSGFDFAQKEGLPNELYPLLGFAATGMLIMVSTRDLFVLFIGLEIASLSVYILVGSQRYAKVSAEAALKYFLLGGAASSAFLYGISLFYGSTGTTAFSGFVQMLTTHWQQGHPPVLPTLALVFLLGGFLFKLGGFPLQFWIPDVYTGAPMPITGFMITGVKAASLGAFLRFCIEVLLPHHLVNPQSFFFVIFAVAAVGSLLYGALVGLAQTDLKRLMAYSTIVHTGFIILGMLAILVSGEADISAFTAVYSYILFYVVMNLGTFAILTMLTSSEHDDLSLNDLAGLYKQRPFLAFCLSVFMMSMAGLPQTAGFLGKYQVLSAGVASGQSMLVFFGIVASVLSIPFYLRPLVYMYMNELPAQRPRVKCFSGVMAAASLSMVFTILLGIFPGWVLCFF